MSPSRRGALAQERVTRDDPSVLLLARQNVEGSARGVLLCRPLGPPLATRQRAAVVFHLVRHESIVAGLAQITLLGVKDDVPARFSVGELLGKPRAELPFSFRYFQTIEQAVVLPEGFEPFEAEVRVRSSKLRAPVQQKFAWKVAGQPVAAL